jgi:hypothetical protein
LLGQNQTARQLAVMRGGQERFVCSQQEEARQRKSHLELILLLLAATQRHLESKRFLLEEMQAGLILLQQIRLPQVEYMLLR